MTARTVMLVSVVIPTYNPGRYLDPGIASLMAQTLDPREFEVIVVDDGSTDGTPGHLDELASRYPNMVVVHSEHSGWAGRPRNIGIEQARGEFIQFMDQDDRMAPDALRRLTDMGRRNGSDIVLGKVASDFRGVALGLYRANRDVCSVHDSEVISSLTPHKMFRRSFLDQHRIRFPEGRRRLEDQLFVVTAYFAARVISIVADATCYFYLRRDDGGNAASNPDWDPAAYYANLREVLDVVVANTEPGPTRDFLMRRFFRAQLVGRLARADVLSWTPDLRAAAFTEVRGIMLDYVDPAVDASLGAVMALRAALVRADRLDDLMALTRRTTDIRAPTQIDSIGWVAGRLVVRSTTELRYGDGTSVAFHRAAGRTTLHLGGGGGIPAEPIDVTAEIPGVRLVTMLRERSTGVEWATTTSLTLDWIAEGSDPDGAPTCRLRIRAVCEADPASVAGRGRLAPGDWAWRMRLAAFGLNVVGALGTGTVGPDPGHDAPLEWPLPQLLRPDLLVTPTRTRDVGVGLQVARVAGAPPGQAMYVRPATSRWQGRVSVRRVARRTFAHLPLGVRVRSASLVRRLRSRGTRL